MLYKLHYVDVVQTHILGIVTNLMLNYNLNPGQVAARYEYETDAMVNPSKNPVNAEAGDNQEEETIDVQYDEEYLDDSEGEEEDADDDSTSTVMYNKFESNQEEEEEEEEEEEAVHSLSDATDTLSEGSPDEGEQQDESIEAKIKRWGDAKVDTTTMTTTIAKSPLFVTTRREFCNAMQNAIKICPRYSTCTNETCKNFHVPEDRICPHVTRGNYCENPECDLIVIRACRKGKRCNDKGCSFRHPIHS